MNKLFAQPDTNEPVSIEDIANSAVESFPLTLAQKRIWSLEQIGNSTVFPFQILSLQWNETVDLDQLQTALNALAHRHSALRTRFRRFAGGRIEQFSIPGDLPSNESVGSDGNPLT
ncbi:MAG: condensation domain-containing protein, partial [Pyrinomonadaceae bacterium]